MAGAACSRVGENVQPIGSEPRAGSLQSLSKDSWRYWRLSPSLIVNDTYTLGSSVGMGASSEACLGSGVVSCMLVHTSRLEKKSLANTGRAALEVISTPAPSCMNQPRWAVLGAKLFRMCCIRRRSESQSTHG